MGSSQCCFDFISLLPQPMSCADSIARIIGLVLTRIELELPIPAFLKEF